MLDQFQVPSLLGRIVGEAQENHKRTISSVPTWTDCCPRYSSLNRIRVFRPYVDGLLDWVLLSMADIFVPSLRGRIVGNTGEDHGRM